MIPTDLEICLRIVLHSVQTYVMFHQFYFARSRLNLSLAVSCKWAMINIYYDIFPG